MSGPELDYKISSSEAAIACLRKTTNICLDLNKTDQRNQATLRNFKLQIQPQAVLVYNLSILNKPKSRKTFASFDLAPDPSAGLDSGGIIAQGFRGPSEHQRDHTMHQDFKLKMQSQAVPVSNLSILTKPTSRKTVASSDLC